MTSRSSAAASASRNSVVELTSIMLSVAFFSHHFSVTSIFWAVMVDDILPLATAARAMDGILGANAELLSPMRCDLPPGFGRAASARGPWPWPRRDGCSTRRGEGTAQWAAACAAIVWESYGARLLRAAGRPTPTLATR
eukprot:CAMPEP_0182863800 /NCGR_PEP_ID=MMETSP0034_2-20130328/6840_1 /TAXON_ID=156128 /ORGANISM="Nephroselmis pyriformis, Strain CCMP717" /LENGTH=138 /DNA_ID=CAMNT_0024996039 /DNA_START=368 /DNA_END=780 /DNA_ORIENTATION=-